MQYNRRCYHNMILINHFTSVVVDIPCTFYLLSRSTSQKRLSLVLALVQGKSCMTLSMYEGEYDRLGHVCSVFWESQFAQPARPQNWSANVTRTTTFALELKGRKNKNTSVVVRCAFVLVLLKDRP